MGNVLNARFKQISGHKKLVDALQWRFSYISASLLIQGLGTDEDTLNEILASRTNREIREINRVYREGKF